MLDIKNEKDVEKAYKYVSDDIVGDWYQSTEYQNAWNRYVKRIDAYYRRHSTTSAKWRSKLYFASFFIACNAMEAQFKAAHSSDPFIFVSAADNSRVDPDAREKAALAHADLNFDLTVSRFKAKLYDMFYYLNIFGTAVGREYIRSKPNVVKRAGRNIDQYNIDQGMLETEEYSRQEYTSTDIIHPLNFGHDKTKKGFIESEWATCRFELTLSDLFAMEDNPHYYQPGVKKLIEKIEKEEYHGYNVSQNEYYSEKGDCQQKNIIIVNEYSGPLLYAGNRRDTTFYYGLYSKEINDFLKIGPSTFEHHNLWKLTTNPAPDGPYGMGPNDPLLPINDWENYTINQYVDWMTTALKFMFEVQPDNIVGGMQALINGLPNGLIPLDKDVKIGETMKNVNLNQYSMPPVRDVLELISRSKQEYGASSNLRGRDQGSNADTATGISLLAEREDTITTSLLDNIDLGLQDGMQIKLKNATSFFNEPRVAQLSDGSKTRRVQHYPYELKGMDWAFKVKRELGDSEAGKHMSFLKLITGIDQVMSLKGMPIPAQQLADLIVQIGTNLNIDGMDKLKSELKPQPINVPGTMPGMAPGIPQKQPLQNMELNNAMATA